MPSTEIEIRDESLRPLPWGTPGEVVVRGPQVMAGYWQHAEDTWAVMTPDGFLRTGDIGVLDERGYLRLLDRQ